MSAALGIVALTADDARPARWNLAGRAVLGYAVSALADAVEVAEVVVAPVQNAAPLTVVANVLSQHDVPAVVVVHDPLRPLVSARFVDDLIRALVRSDAAVAAPVMPVTDTLKSVDHDGYVIGTLDRALYHAVSPPVAVRGAALFAALAVRPDSAEAGRADLAAELLALFREHGASIVTVPGMRDAIRVSDAAHLEVAEAIIAARSAGQAMLEGPALT